MKFVQRSAFVMMVLLLGTLMLFAGNKNRIGTAGAQELLIPVGAKGIALSGANLATITGSDAAYYNPAGVVRAGSSVDAQFSTMNHLGDALDVSYAAVAINAGSIGSFALSMKSLDFGDIPVTTEEFTDGTGETYSPSYVNLGLTYSVMLSDRVSVGATATVVSEKIMSTSATGLAFNLGVQYSGLGLPGLNLGVAVKNVGTDMKFDGANLNHPGTVNDARRNASPNWYKVLVTPFDLPTEIEIGLGYNYVLDDQNSLAISGNFQNNNYSVDEYKLGLEYNFQKMLYVRGGYVLAPEAPVDPTGENSYLYDYSFGVGVALDLGGASVKADYAYRNSKYFSASNVFTIGFGF